MNRGNFLMRRACAALAAACALTAAAAAPGFARGTRRIAQQGNAAFRDGDFARAAARYQSARELQPGDPALYFDLGTALYKQDNYNAALKAFQSLQPAKNDRLAALAHYNQGNALARLGRDTAQADPLGALDLYRKAVSAYKRAFAIRPDFHDAVYNIEVVRCWMSDLEERIREMPKVPANGPTQESRNGDKKGSPGGQSGERGPSDDPGSGGKSGESPEAGGTASGSAGDIDQGALKNETARSILEEEQQRRQAEARAGGKGSRYERPTW